MIRIQVGMAMGMVTAAVQVTATETTATVVMEGVASRLHSDQSKIIY